MQNLSKEELIKVYQNTSFESEINGCPIIIEIGQTPQMLNSYINKIKCKSWAFLTAANPCSHRLSALENATRNEELEKSLIKLRLSFYEGLGKALTGNWTPEESYLVLGISREESTSLSKKNDQNAFVFGEVTMPAELIWTGV